MNKHKEERYLELQDQARNCCLDKINFDISEWLDDEDYKEYLKLDSEANNE